MMDVARPAKDLSGVLLLLAVYLVAAHFAFTASLVADADFWWHLRTGQWILDHHTVPTTDPFSQSGAGQPWVAYSWLFELLLVRLYQRFGLTAIFVYKVPVLLGILWSMLALLRRAGQSLYAATGWTALLVLTLTPLMTPRPWLLTIFFFSLELHLLLHFRQTGNARCLWWLLPLFAVWANAHIQFIYGFVPLFLVVAEPVLESFLRRPFSRRWLRTAWRERVWLWFPAGVIATLFTPYYWRLYRPVFEIARQTSAFEQVLELQSMNFRQPAHWIVLGLALGAAYQLGRQRVRQAFPLLFFLASTLLSFRAHRDIWVLALASLTVIALARTQTAAVKEQAGTKLKMLVVFLLGCGGALLLAPRYGITEAALQTQIEQTYPVAAARVVEERGMRGPLYNHFTWGGYLIWRLPQLPVSLDGRTNLYGAARIQRSLDTWNGRRDWATDAELNAAGVVIADVKMPLCSLLRLDPRFELVYEDAIAAVFRKRP